MTAVADTGRDGPRPEPAERPARVVLDAGDHLSARSWPTFSWLAAILVVAPVAFLAASILRPSGDVWRQQWETRLPGQLWDTTVLLVGVSIGALALGVGLAWLTSAHRFPGSKVLGWLLVAPLAMPSYVLGFVTLSVVGFTGPIQGWWRDTFGVDAWFPEVRSLGGAVVVFSLVLYPYVYLLARAALRDQAGGAYEVARSLGAGPFEAARRVVFPQLRPAIAAGVAVVMMETLTDFATVQYFGVDTVSVGVFRIWRGTFDRDAASELATLVLVFALLVIGLERVLRGRARYGEAAGRADGIRPRQLRGVRGLAATGACVAVLALSFALPAAQLVAWAIERAGSDNGTPVTDRFLEFLGHSLQLAVVSAIICGVVAAVVVNASRFGNPRATRLAARLTAVGYAVPGPVVAIGVLLALVALDDVLETVGLGLPGVVATGSFIGLVYAYSVRFMAPALNATEAGLEQVPEEMTASARSLGRRPWQVAGRIHVPLSRTSLATAVVLVAVDALKELPIVLLLRPFGFDTLSVWTYNLASESRFEQAALPALAIVVVALVPVAVLIRGHETRAGATAAVRSATATPIDTIEGEAR
ncbi:MAG: iron ABC transporter permease [Actinomycetota bacterium]|nr:iron ABC transporter permease [Actinomycetota bacterium]